LFYKKEEVNPGLNPGFGVLRFGLLDVFLVSPAEILTVFILGSGVLQIIFPDLSYSKNMYIAIMKIIYLSPRDFYIHYQMKTFVGSLQ
jgi:hypothetical protein